MPQHPLSDIPEEGAVELCLYVPFLRAVASSVKEPASPAFTTRHPATQAPSRALKVGDFTLSHAHAAELLRCQGQHSRTVEDQVAEGHQEVLEKQKVQRAWQTTCAG